MYVNGQATRIGYLSGLRALPGYRNRGLVARAYRMFGQLHADGRTPLYLTTIADGNQPALATLTSRRAGLPAYHFAGMYHTVIIPVGRGRLHPAVRDNDIRIRSAVSEDRPLILDFLNDVGPSRQFFPCYRLPDLFTENGLLRGLSPSALLLAFRKRQLVGTLGAWDQHAYKQTVVERYGWPWNWSRHGYNLWARCLSRPTLPAPGAPIRYLSAAIPVIAEGVPNVAAALLDTLLARSAGGSCSFLAVGLHETDPLLPLVKQYQTGSYLTRVYLVCWNDGESLRVQLDDRPVYLELGSL